MKKKEAEWRPPRSRASKAWKPLSSLRWISSPSFPPSSRYGLSSCGNESSLSLSTDIPSPPNGIFLKCVYHIYSLCWCFLLPLTWYLMRFSLIVYCTYCKCYTATITNLFNEFEDVLSSIYFFNLSSFSFFVNFSSSKSHLFLSPTSSACTIGARIGEAAHRLF